MKKLLLLLLIPLTLFGCSQDRNMDGEFTISDMSLAFQDYLIPFGEPVLNAFNLFLNSSFGAFLELETIYPDKALMVAIGRGSFLILVLFDLLILYLIYLFSSGWIPASIESWNEIKKEFNQEQQIGGLKKIYRFSKSTIGLILSSLITITIISFIIYAIICSLTALEYNY